MKSLRMLALANRIRNLPHQRRSKWPPLLLLFAVCLLASTIAGIAPTLSETQKPLKGVALVIGQSDYEHLDPLANPENDAREIEELLDDLGFETDIRSDRTAKKLRRDIDSFVEDADGADVAFVYYSGHGIEAGAENYLVPIDADLDALESAEKAMVPLSGILERLRTRAKITILLIDACRTNPFPEGALLKTSQVPEGVPITGSGLGAPKGAFAATGTADESSLGVVIGFAAEPGRAALDGTPETSSPYAAALIKHLPARGVTFGDVMTMVTEEVYLKTKTWQRPWTNASLRRLLYFGDNPEEPGSDSARIKGARRNLLLTISTTPHATRSFVETLAAEDNLPLDALYGMLKELKVDTTAGPGELETQLRVGARNLKRFLEERTPSVRKDADLIRLASLADEAQTEGALALAKEFRELASARADELAEILDQREEDLKADRLELAETYAEHAQTASLAFDYLTAAEKYEAAFEQVERWDDTLARRYRFWQAGAYSDHGFMKGDNSALEKAIDIYRDVERRVDKATEPQRWALLQNNIGYAFWRLGARESGPEKLKQAVAAYEAALKIPLRDEEPHFWATLQNNLANALQVLADRESGNETLERAIVAYRAALEVRTRKDAPHAWAMTQNDMGNALWTLGLREDGTVKLKQAAAAFEAALEVRNRKDDALSWAETQNNLGNTLQMIGERELDFATMRRAAAAYEAALEVLTRDLVPLQWATNLNNLAAVLANLGAVDLDGDKLRRSIEILKQALEERTRERVPLDWAMSHVNLGNSYQFLGVLEANPDHHQDAATSFEEALKEFTRERTPRQWATAQSNLGHALNSLGTSRGDVDMLRRSAAAYQAALRVFTKEHVRADWINLQNSLGTVLTIVGQQESGTENAARAAQAFEALLGELNRDQETYDWATTQNNLGYALSMVGERTRDAETLLRAIGHYEAALTEQTGEKLAAERSRTQFNMGSALLLAGLHKRDSGLLERGKQAIIAVRDYYRSIGDRQHDAELAERIATFDQALELLR